TPQGERVMPALMGGNDTVALCHAINELQIPYSWQILNRAIALKEFAVSGSEHNVAIRDRRLFRFIRELVFGNRTLVDQMCAECEDFVVADSLEELADKMAKQTSDHRLDKTMFSNTVKDFDALLQEQPASDTQIKTLHTIREYMPDKFRTLKPQSLLAQPPYIAIKVRLISRKSMGGIMTNLQSQALNAADEVIPGLYCVGEAAGFGGGGSSGKKSLEGTFLSGCILTARQEARSLL
ncbi:MAG: FAD-binding protein, partial [Gammaproteobacteria bacterium]